MRTLPTVIKYIKEAATASKMVNQIKLVRDENDLNDIFEDSNYRALYIVVEDADVLSNDDYYGITLVLIDKTSNLSDESYLYSINDGIAAFRKIHDTLNYNAESGVRVDLKTIEIDSGSSKGELITVLKTTIEYTITAVPNIHG